MGILDDAIREHLELKRRSGADPQEIERLEREALGPVRRGPHDAYEASGVATAGTGPAAVGEEPGGAWPSSEDESFALDQTDELAEDHELEEWELPERGPVEGGIGAEPAAAEPTPPPPPAPAEPTPVHAEGSLVDDDYLEQETVEHDLEPETSEEDDMLEETPEFLQDTPDHDRLWFEQRPPRDFDLGG